MSDIDLKDINLKTLHYFFEDIPKMQIQNTDDPDFLELNKILEKAIFTYPDLIFNINFRKKVLKNKKNENFIYGDNLLLTNYINNTTPTDFIVPGVQTFTDYVKKNNKIISNEEFDIYEPYMKNFMKLLVSLDKNTIFSIFKSFNKNAEFYTKPMKFTTKDLTNRSTTNTDVRMFLEHLNKKIDDKVKLFFNLNDTKIDDNILNLIINQSDINAEPKLFTTIEILLNLKNSVYYNYNGIFLKKNKLGIPVNNYKELYENYFGNLDNLPENLKDLLGTDKSPLILRKILFDDVIILSYNDIFKLILISIYNSNPELEQEFKKEIEKLIFKMHQTNSNKNLKNTFFNPEIEVFNGMDNIIENSNTLILEPNIYDKLIDINNKLQEITHKIYNDRGYQNSTLLKQLEDLPNTILRYRTVTSAIYNNVMNDINQKVQAQQINPDDIKNLQRILAQYKEEFKDFKMLVDKSDDGNQYNDHDASFAFLFNLMSYNFNESLQNLIGINIPKIDNTNFIKIFITYYLNKISNIIEDKDVLANDYFEGLLDLVSIIPTRDTGEQKISLNVESYIKLYGYLIVEYKYNNINYYSLYSEYKTSNIKQDSEIVGFLIIPKTIDSDSYFNFYKYIYKNLKVDYADSNIKFLNINKGKNKPTLFLSKEGTKHFINGIEKQKTLRELANFYFLIYTIDKRKYDDNEYIIEKDDEKLYLLEQLLFKLNLTVTSKKVKTLDNKDITIIATNKEHLTNATVLKQHLEKENTFFNLDNIIKNVFTKNMYIFITGLQNTTKNTVDVSKSEYPNKKDSEIKSTSASTDTPVPESLSTDGFIYWLRKYALGGGESNSDDTYFVFERPSLNYINLYSIKELSEKPLDIFISEIDSLNYLRPNIRLFHKDLDILAKNDKLNIDNIVDILPNELRGGGISVIDIFNNTGIKNPNNFEELKDLFDKNKENSIFKNSKIFFNETFSQQDLMDIKKITLDINNCFYNLQKESNQEICNLINRLTNFDRNDDLSNLNEDELKFLLKNLIQKHELNLEIYKQFAALMSYKKFKSKINYKPTKEEDNEIFALFKANLQDNFEKYNNIMGLSVKKTLSDYPRLYKIFQEILQNSF